MLKSPRMFVVLVDSVRHIHINETKATKKQAMQKQHFVYRYASDTKEIQKPLNAN